jgi:hypothetical protein
MDQAPNFSFCSPTDKEKWVENLPLTLLHMWFYVPLVCDSALSYMQTKLCQYKKLFRLHEYIVNL